MKYLNCRGFLNLEIIVVVGSPYGSQVVLSLNSHFWNAPSPFSCVCNNICSTVVRQVSSSLWKTKSSEPE